MEKYMIARKEYHCDNCQRIIKIGELYLLDKGRAPRYSSDAKHADVQIGINYYQYRLCLKPDCGKYHEP